LKKESKKKEEAAGSRCVENNPKVKNQIGKNKQGQMISPVLTSKSYWGISEINGKNYGKDQKGFQKSFKS